MNKYTADFETCVWKENETWVWAWAIHEIGHDYFKYGNDIYSFMDFCKNSNNSIFYFHNLKFDGEFIIYWLLTNGFKHIEDKTDVKDNTFTTLISDIGQFYQITVYFSKGNKQVKKATFIDSLKIIPFSVAETAKYFDLPISKLEIDYKKEREIGHKLTTEEIEYIKNDVLIMAKALEVVFSENLTKMTRASNAISDYKEIITERKFNHFFPHLEKEIDEDIRKSYKGGFTYVNPIYKEKDVDSGVVLDVNSLYPYVMYTKLLPYSEPIFYTGKYKQDKVYPLYIQMITCCFKLKPNKIPCIQIKNNRFLFKANEYLEYSGEDPVCLVLTNVDLELFFEQYDVSDLEYVSGWKFKALNNFFIQYIDKWIEKKNFATINKNLGQRTMAKLMLNSLYGKFASSLEVKSKIPFLEDDIVRYKTSEKKDKEGLYIPIGSFITSYAREKTIRTSQAIVDYSLKKYGKNLYLYSDTDSIHTLLKEEELKQFCEIDGVKLGAWKVEAKFKKARFIRQKCYIEEVNDNIEITCAGMPKNCYDKVTWNNFKVGFTCGGKLTFKHVKRWCYISGYRFYY